MGLGNGKPKAIYLQIKAKGIEGETKSPVFHNYKSGEYDGKFDGDLVGMSVREKSDNNKYASIQMEFVDEKLDRYVISSSFSQLATSIINSFAGGVDSKNTFEKIGLSLYSKNDYARIGVFQNGEMMKWKYDIEQLKGMTKDIVVNGEDQKDKTELLEMMRKEIISINTYLQSLQGEEVKETAIEDMETEGNLADELAEVEKNPKIQTKTPAKETKDDDDLPF